MKSYAQVHHLDWGYKQELLAQALGHQGTHEVGGVVDIWVLRHGRYAGLTAHACGEGINSVTFDMS